MGQMSTWTKRSKEEPDGSSNGGSSDQQIQDRLFCSDPSGPSCVSLKSDQSKMEPIEFQGGGHSDHNIFSHTSSCVYQTDLDSIFKVLEDDIATFVKAELKRIKNILSPEGSERPKEVNEETNGEEERKKSNRDAFLKIALNFLRRRKHEQLADALQNKTHVMISQRRIKTNLTRRFQCLLEGNSQSWSSKFVNQIYTELYITRHGGQEVNNQPEVQQIEATSWIPASSETTITCEDIFNPGREEPIRTLMTKGVSGIGKTVFTQKYILDWAEDKTNHNIHFIFPFTFRELNLLNDKTYSLVGLIHYFFAELKYARICNFEEFQVMFIFDGLDECRPPLDFHNTQVLTDITEPASVHVLITNLIKGKLLPSSGLWITTRPAAANQVPPEYVDMVTEIRGFTDIQKEEYFGKNFRHEEQASRIISHIKTSQSLHTMCRIPIFCWITATVLDHVLKVKEKKELPKTLTELYIHFLVVQAQLDNAKYHTKPETDTLWNAETKKIILALGKLAFEQLEIGNLMFYKDDLKRYGIDLNTASVYSGMFTETLNGESGLNHERLFCFVHLSIHEFLAALYVFLKFMNSGVNLLRKRRMAARQDAKVEQLYQNAVDKALESPNGYLDMFARFLLGLSLKDNQTHLRGLMKSRGKNSQVKEMLVQYIKKKISFCPSPEKSIRMFYWLNELNDYSLESEIQQHLKGSDFAKELTPSQWSALAFILLSSQKDLEMFDLKKFSASKEALVWLLPVVKASNKSLLSDCNLSWRSCISLMPALTSDNSCLRVLDLSNNNLHDAGVNILSQGLRSLKCRLEVLSLSGCQVREEGCASLASALSCNPSHLRELDLSFNHPGESGLNGLSAGLQNPDWKLQTLKTDHCGKCRLNPSPQRFFCELTLDPNTANRNLLLSEDKHVLVVKQKQQYPDHPERFDSWKQVLCSEGFTGRCYWEVRWKGSVRIGVAYKGIKRKGDSEECCIGRNNHSWSVFCTSLGISVWHNNTQSEIKILPTPDSDRIAVYLDWSAGTVSFYCLPGVVSSIKKIHLHTFQAAFTEPLYPAFGFGQTFEFEKDSTLLSSSVLLLEVD
ncbi:protein NLRC3 [Kryptolebias marmoratus]|uniref:protein NLRC3 n=1 Tax=Kryptolebias marmoratus TaxID=37003 RepID=UPI000D52F430|nr:protein NLRC3 [Kryptolebias marmoratus]XP_024859023.1 protein NLRC3 [Kryptolebias marmoratus]XP_024859024.1 protein NLRC3 [Kryptolebias marmoratus]